MKLRSDDWADIGIIFTICLALLFVIVMIGVNFPSSEENGPHDIAYLREERSDLRDRLTEAHLTIDQLEYELQRWRLMGQAHAATGLNHASGRYEVILTYDFRGEQDARHFLYAIGPLLETELRYINE